MQAKGGAISRGGDGRGAGGLGALPQPRTSAIFAYTASMAILPLCCTCLALSRACSAVMDLLLSA